MIELECPLCQSDVRESDVPNVYVCKDCLEPFQLIDDALVRLNPLLEKNALGDDRIRRAVNPPHVSNIRSLLDVQDNIYRAFEMEKKAASGSMRTILSQAHNRLEVALNCLAEIAVVSDKAEEGLSALREAMELISPLPSANRGVGEGRGD